MTPIAALALVGGGAESEDSFTDSIAETPSQEAVVSAIDRLIDYKNHLQAKKEASDRGWFEVLKALVVKAEVEEQEAESAAGAGASGVILKALSLMGRTVLNAVLKPVFTTILRTAMAVGRLALRGIMELVVRPVLTTAIRGLLMAGPWGWAGLAIAGFGYWAYQKWIERPSIGSFDLRKSDDYVADYGLDGYSPSAGTKDYDQATTVQDYPDYANTPENVALASKSSGNKKFGFIAKAEESGKGGVATVSTGKGDHGGVSYGAHQLASRNGSMNRFLNSPEGKPFAKFFAGMTPGSGEFNAAYRDVAAKYPDEFASAQHAYIVRTHYGVQAKRIQDALGIDVNKRSLALQEAIFSVAVQYGPGSSIVIEAWKRYGDSLGVMTDAELINILYDHKFQTVDKYFKSSSPAVQESIRRRANRERGAVLAYNKGDGAQVANNTVAAPGNGTAVPKLAKSVREEVAETQAPSGSVVATGSNKSIAKTKDGRLVSVDA